MSSAAPGSTAHLFEVKSAQLPLVTLLLKSTHLNEVANELQQRYGNNPDFFAGDPLLIDLSVLRESEESVEWSFLLPLLRPVLFRLLDDSGARVPEMNLLLTAGPSADPNQLPQGFLTDRQGNRRAPGNLCFFLNHAALAGCPEIRDGERLVREALVPRPPYGLRLLPRQDEQLVEHWLAELGADVASLLDLVRPNETTIIDLRLTRVVREGVFRLGRSLAARDFRDDPPGGAI